MEQDRKEKAPAPAEAWDRAAAEKEKVAAKVAVKGGDKVKVAAKPRGKAAGRISKPFEKTGE